MEFKPLTNFRKIMRRTLNNNSNNPSPFQFVDTSLTTRNLYNDIHNYMTFSVWGSGSETSVGSSTIFPKASSYDTFDTEDIYQVPNVVGTSKITGQSLGSKGTSVSFEVTGQEGDVIKSIFFCRKLYYTSSSNSEAVLFAIKLDTPITIDNTGIASFVFSAEF